ncbi:hypothetical protein [Shewanella mangrovisoli]|uniref:hypothetical protein n=1 Tax=Shewanella mangrovisoli TaxID=2864211 RepID=UPI001C65A548|nr:hypothetical protein [Shewanella mangrovisoli]QYK07597.1 hypothetical protein K0H60_12185 [Shewanella mangrovisoli]
MMILNGVCSSAIFCLMVILTSVQSAYATIYKCHIDGKLVLQDKECPEGVKQTMVNIDEKNPVANSSGSSHRNLLESYKHISEPVSYVSSLYGAQVNRAGSFTVSDIYNEVLFESLAGFVTFVEIRFKSTSPCSQSNYYNYAEYSRLLGLDITLMSKLSGTAHYANSFKDFKNRLKVTFMCPFDGSEYSASFSQSGFLNNQ